MNTKMQYSYNLYFIIRQKILIINFEKTQIEECVEVRNDKPSNLE